MFNSEMPGFQTEMDSLKEVIQCLKHSKDGTHESMVHYQAQGALYEAECTLRVLLQRFA
jgi:hypothetical protein